MFADVLLLSVESLVVCIGHVFPGPVDVAAGDPIYPVDTSSIT